MKDNKEHIKRNKKILRLVRSDGWKLAKEYIYNLINDYQSVMNVDGKDAEDVFLDIKVRKIVCSELDRFVKNFEGQAQQFEVNELSPDERGKESLIHRQ